MGTFDTVYFTCWCSNTLSIQSKAGDCAMEYYCGDPGHEKEVPPAVLGDMIGMKVKCPDCGRIMKIEGTIHIRKIYTEPTKKWKRTTRDEVKEELNDAWRKANQRRGLRGEQ